MAQVAGPSLAGALVQAIGGSYAVGVDALSFLTSATALAALRTKEPSPSVPKVGHNRIRHDIGEGLQFVFGQPLLRAIAATTATSNIFSGILSAVEIVFLVRVVHAVPAIIGLLLAMGAAGGLVGALVATPMADG